MVTQIYICNINFLWKNTIGRDLFRLFGPSLIQELAIFLQSARAYDPSCPSVCQLIGLSCFPKRVGSYTSMLLSGHFSFIKFCRKVGKTQIIRQFLYSTFQVYIIVTFTSKCALRSDGPINTNHTVGSKFNESCS